VVVYEFPRHRLEIKKHNSIYLLLLTNSYSILLLVESIPQNAETVTWWYFLQIRNFLVQSRDEQYEDKNDITLVVVMGCSHFPQLSIQNKKKFALSYHFIWTPYLHDLLWLLQLKKFSSAYQLGNIQMFCHGIGLCTSISIVYIQMWTINSRRVEWRTHETRNNGGFGTCSIGHRTYQWSWSSSMLLARPNFFAILIQPILQVKYMVRISKHHYTRHLWVWGARMNFFGLTFAHRFFLRNHAEVHKYTFTHILT